MFDFIYKQLYILGLYTARYVGRFFKRISSFFSRPFKALGAFLFAGIVMLKTSIKDRTEDAREIVDEAKSSRSKNKSKAKPKSFAELLKLIFSKNGIAITLVTEVVAPVVSFVILLATINYYSSKNLALKITYNDADVGYVSSESVYLEAQEKAQQRLQTAKVTGEGTGTLKNAQYAIVPAKISELKNADAICNKLIERSGSNITNACGIYINGEFLCAVKNETDAETVFDNMLTSYKDEAKKQEEEIQNQENASEDNQSTDEKPQAEQNDSQTQSDNSEQTTKPVEEGEQTTALEQTSQQENNEASEPTQTNDENEAEEQTQEDENAIDGSTATISFAEDIQYIQGLYPDDSNTILDASGLSQKLENSQKEAVYYIAHSGDTFAGVAGQYNISVNELKELNPNLSAYLKDGDKVLISKSQDLVRVQLTRTETRTVELAYDTIEIETSSLFKGIKKTVSEGVNGEQEVTELVTYIGGEKVAVQEVSRVTTVEPIPAKVQVGTKKNPYGTATSYGGRFLWPAIGAYSISSYYGNRSMGWHGGIDIVKPGGHSTGLTIVAADDGVVVSAGYHFSWGYNVVVNHGGGLSTRYAHMIKGSFKVSPGQKVSAGQPLGSIGSTGNVTGPHLHFEVMVNGNRVDPLPYLGR